MNMNMNIENITYPERNRIVESREEEQLPVEEKA